MHYHNNKSLDKIDINVIFYYFVCEIVSGESFLKHDFLTVLNETSHIIINLITVNTYVR